MTLDEYVRAEMARRWRWGSVDCVEFGRKWICERTGRNLPAFAKYGNWHEAMAVLAERGGLAAIVREWMAVHGFEQTECPEDGDVGIANVPIASSEGTDRAAIVIRRGPWWLTREREFPGVGGIGAVLEVPAAWRIC